MTLRLLCYIFIGVRGHLFTECVLFTVFFYMILLVGLCSSETMVREPKGQLETTHKVVEFLQFYMVGCVYVFELVRDIYAFNFIILDFIH